ISAAPIDTPNNQRVSTRSYTRGSRRDDVMGRTLGLARTLRKVASFVTRFLLKVRTATVSSRVVSVTQSSFEYNVSFTHHQRMLVSTQVLRGIRPDPANRGRTSSTHPLVPE